MMVVSFVVAAVLPVDGGAVLVNVIGVPFLRPVTTALESAPRKELKSELILSTTLESPWLEASVFILVASEFNAVVVCAIPRPDDQPTIPAARNKAEVFIVSFC
jgi:hypothetical protein